MTGGKGLYLRSEPVLGKGTSESNRDSMLLDVSQRPASTAPKLTGFEVYPEYQLEFPRP